MRQYHADVVSNVLIVIAKELDEDSVGIAEKYGFPGSVLSTDQLPRDVVFPDSVVNDSTD